jgi:regulatory protein
VRLTALRESPRRPGRYAVVFSDGTRLLVSLQALVEAGALAVGVDLSPVARAALERDARVTALVDRALAALARGRRTRRELALRLGRVEGDRALVEAALARVEATGALSDTEMAHAEARSRLGRGEGPARVRQRLRRKGIAGGVAASAVAGAAEESGYDEATACRAAAERRLRALAGQEPMAVRRRLAAFLQRRGFTPGTVAAVLRALAHDLPDEPPGGFPGERQGR